MLNKDVVVLIHFQPLELYPPVQNFIKYWQQSDASRKLVVISTTFDPQLKFNCNHRNIIIHRFGKFSKIIKSFRRYAGYLHFYAGCIYILLKYKPAKIFYYETLSSFAAVLYKKWFRNTGLYIHYHEYTTLKEYQGGMLLTRQFHRMEQKIYSSAQWISHTNEQRMVLFLKDNPDIPKSICYLLPNYPPKEWGKKITGKKRLNFPVKFIYVGATSLDTMYLAEFCRWVEQLNGKAVLDIYSLNITDEALAYLETRRKNLINLKPGIDYSLLPERLQGYDIGLILYKGHIPNYIFNAPNKLFEYVACGLDVWFPALMEGCSFYISTMGNPRVLPIDFDNLAAVNLEEMVMQDRPAYKASVFNMESVYQPILEALL